MKTNCCGFDCRSISFVLYLVLGVALAFAAFWQSTGLQAQEDPERPREPVAEEQTRQEHRENPSILRRRREVGRDQAERESPRQRNRESRDAEEGRARSRELRRDDAGRRVEIEIRRRIDSPRAERGVAQLLADLRDEVRRLRREVEQLRREMRARPFPPRRFDGPALRDRAADRPRRERDRARLGDDVPDRERPDRERPDEERLGRDRPPRDRDIPRDRDRPGQRDREQPRQGDRDGDRGPEPQRERPEAPSA